MKSVKLYSYNLQMLPKQYLGGVEHQYRSGLIIELKDGSKVARSEIAPLPHLSVENLPQAKHQVIDAAYLWLRGESVNVDALSPSVAFGFSTALADLDEALPCQYIEGLRPAIKYHDHFELSLLSYSPDVLTYTLGEQHIEKDAVKIKEIIKLCTNTKLRLIGKKQWTLVQAKAFANTLTPTMREKIQFILDPCQTPEESLSFAIDTGLPVAWDETFYQLMYQNHMTIHDLPLKDFTGVKAIVVKPMLIGSISQTSELIARIQKMGIQPIIGSTLETTVGLNRLAGLSKCLIPEGTPLLDNLDGYTCQVIEPWSLSSAPLVGSNELVLEWDSACSIDAPPIL
ncbi:o-succinylbenzoate synthase [Vibrio sp.]|nr:o-succinylbenzoate synthase [Vibrio sp.]